MSIQKTPEKSTILFMWFNQYAGILLKTPSKTVAIDPVDIKPKSLPNVDAILITHEHYDHLDPGLITEIQKETNCTIIADSASTRKLQHAIPIDKLQEIKAGAETKVGEVSIKAEKCNHPAEAPVTYIITSEDGVKAYHAADSLPFPELAAMGRKEKFDLVFCAVGIAPGSTPQTGFEIARLTKPKVAVPYHTASAASQTEFAQIIKKELPGTACLIPEQNKVYQVSKREVKNLKVDQAVQEKKEKMANILFKVDAIEFGVFKLSSGKASPYYVDLRVIPSFPDAFREICDFYAEYITSQIEVKSFDRIAGVPLTGIIFASQVAYNLKKPFLYVRKRVRLHGRERRVEGILVSGDRVLLIDDLATTGLTLKKAAQAVRAEGGVVTDAVVFLDREEGAKQQLGKSGISLHPIVKMSEIASLLYDSGVMDQESLKTILKQVKKQ